MKKLYYALAMMLMSVAVSAHELTPTHPVIEPAYLSGVSVIEMSLWNRRNDVKYYEINVYDIDWTPVEFATTERLIKIGYLERKIFEVYVRDEDKDKVEYICTVSKQLKEDVKSSGIKSRICSRMK